MKRIHIDFAPPTFHRAIARTSPATWMAALAGLCVCLGAVAAAQRSLQQAAQAEAKRAAVMARHAPARPANLPDAPISAAQATAVNAIIARLNVPWRDLFRTMEATTPGDRIALLELTPDPVRLTLKGSAEARNSEDMLAYMTRLAAQPFFASVTLTSHEVNLQDPNRPLRFQFAAQWRSNAPGVGRPAPSADASPPSIPTPLATVPGTPAGSAP